MNKTLMSLTHCFIITIPVRELTWPVVDLKAMTCTHVLGHNET